MEQVSVARDPPQIAVSEEFRGRAQSNAAARIVSRGGMRWPSVGPPWRIAAPGLASDHELV
jgi:hypothetical protein